MTAQGAYIAKLVPEGFLTRRQLADALGCHIDTVIRWELRGDLEPAAYMENGKVTTPLYTLTQDDVGRMQATLKERSR